MGTQRFHVLDSDSILRIRLNGPDTLNSEHLLFHIRDWIFSSINTMICKRFSIFLWIKCPYNHRNANVGTFKICLQPRRVIAFIFTVILKLILIKVIFFVKELWSWGNVTFSFHQRNLGFFTVGCHSNLSIIQIYFILMK